MKRAQDVDVGLRGDANAAFSSMGCGDCYTRGRMSSSHHGGYLVNLTYAEVATLGLLLFVAGLAAGRLRSLVSHRRR